jgi:aminopeptidase N
MMRSFIMLLCVAFCAPYARAEPALRDTLVLKADPLKGTVHLTITMFRSNLLNLRIAPWFNDGRIQPGAATTPADITISGTVPNTPKNDLFPADQAFAKDGWLCLPGLSWVPTAGEGTASYHLTVEVPSPYRAVATGRLESEELRSDVNRATFVTENAIEPPSVFAGLYVVNERQSAGVRLRTYFTQNTANLAEPYLDTADSYIKRFSAEIGPYPFADFHMVAAPLPVGLAFPGLTYIDERILPLPFMRERSLGHEILHNWWGNGVIPAGIGNWSEGLTTYMADHALAATHDPKDALDMRVSWLRDYAALPVDKDTPITRFFSKTHDADQIVGYGKTAYVFHMLKDEVGEEHFTAAIRRFWKDYRGHVASWSDIRKTFETEAGTDLGWFFDQWLNRTGAPTITLGDINNIPMAKDDRVTITLKQKAPVWRLNVPVDIITKTGTTRVRIPMSGEENTYTLDLESTPLAVRVDPDYTLFRRLLPGEAPPILRDVLLANDVQVVVTGNDPVFVIATYDLMKVLFNSPPPMKTACTSIVPRPKCAFPNRHFVPTSPLVLVGPRDAIESFIEKAGLPPRPANVQGGNTRVWTAAREGAGPVLVIETEKDAPFIMTQALDKLAQRLPHYRSKSFVVFDSQRAIANGVWPPTPAPMSKQFNQ